MRSFKDAKKDTWPIELPIGAVVRVRKASDGKFNLLEPLTNELASTLNSDEGLGDLYEVLWFLLEPEAIKRGVDAEEFGQRIAADCILEAREQFFKEWADFFRRLQREQMAIALEQMAALSAKGREMINQRVKEATKGLMDQATPKFESILNDEFGNLQDSLAAILGPTP